MFITIEGCEFTGKSTQAKILYDRIDNINKILTHEPGGTNFAEQIRTLLKTAPDLTIEQQFLLFHAARLDHINKLIKPFKDCTIICDRYIDSTYVYQHSVMNEEEWDQYYLDIYNKDGYPNLTFILDMSSEKAIERSKNRKIKDHWDNESVEEMNKKRNLFLDASFFHNSNRRIYFIKADQAEEKVSEDIWKMYNLVLKKNK